MLRGLKLQRRANTGTKPRVWSITPFSDLSALWVEYGQQGGKMRPTFVPIKHHHTNGIEGEMQRLVRRKLAAGYQITRTELNPIFGEYLVPSPYLGDDAADNEQFVARVKYSMPTSQDAKKAFTARVARVMENILREIQGVNDISVESTSLLARVMVRVPKPFPFKVIDLECWRRSFVIEEKQGLYGVCVGLLAHYLPDTFHLCDRDGRALSVRQMALQGAPWLKDKFESMGLVSCVELEPDVELGNWFF